MATNPLPQAANLNTVHGGILNASGQPFVGAQANLGSANPSGGGGGGNEHVSDIAGLKKNVGFLNWVAAGGVAALVALYFLLTAHIEQNAKDARDDTTHVSEQISDVKVAVAAQSADLKVLLDRSPKTAEQEKKLLQ